MVRSTSVDCTQISFSLYTSDSNTSPYRSRNHRPKRYCCCIPRGVSWFRLKVQLVGLLFGSVGKKTAGARSPCRQIYTQVFTITNLPYTPIYRVLINTYHMGENQFSLTIPITRHCRTDETPLQANHKGQPQNSERSHFLSNSLFRLFL